MKYSMTIPDKFLEIPPLITAHEQQKINIKSELNAANFTELREQIHQLKQADKR